jgi:hypothetical protein
MPQFSLAYDALDKNLLALGGGGDGLGDAMGTKLTVTIALLLAAGFVVLLKAKEGKTAKLFDLFLKALIGLVVICFVGVVILLGLNGQLNFGEIFSGMIPNIGQWSKPAGELSTLIAGLPAESQDYWNTTILSSQRAVMIAAAATAVGINMTFLLPYSMLSRGWDKPFRGLARFDLSTGMAIPYVLVTTCVVVAAASTFHAKIDDKLSSGELAVMQESPMFDSVKKPLLARIDAKLGDTAESIDEAEKLAMAASLSVEEKKLALSLVKRNAFQLSETLSPLLGVGLANLVFGLGVFGMGFSTIIILMLINGYAFREIVGKPDATAPFVVGCLVAGLFGASWLYVWQGDAKFWLAIFTSSFGMMLLPIAYITFFLMMNSKRILGDEKPKGASMLMWNVLMILSVIGAIVAASAAIYEKAMDKSNAYAFPAIMGLLVLFIVALVVGHFMRKPSGQQTD